MAANTTASESTDDKKDSTMAIAIVLPSLFVIVMVLLLAVTFLLPRLTRPEPPLLKEERKKKRMAKLDGCVKPQHFHDWAAKQKLQNPDAVVTMNPMCVICLDEIENAAQIRPLGCRHVFHQACLDDWYARWNEYCPLCHRPIIPGMREVKRNTEGRPAGVGFLV